MTGELTELDATFICEAGCWPVLAAEGSGHELCRYVEWELRRGRPLFTILDDDYVQDLRDDYPFLLDDLARDLWVLEALHDQLWEPDWSPPQLEADSALAEILSFPTLESPVASVEPAA